MSSRGINSTKDKEMDPGPSPHKGHVGQSLSFFHSRSYPWLTVSESSPISRVGLCITSTVNVSSTYLLHSQTTLTSKLEKRSLSTLALRHGPLWKWFTFTFRMSDVYHEAPDRLQTKLERGVPWDCIHRHEHVRQALSLEWGVVSTSWTLSRGQRRRWRKFGKGATQHTTRRTGDGLLARERPEEHHDGTFEEGGLPYFTSSRVEAGEQDVDTHGSHLEVGFGSMYAHILKKKTFKLKLVFWGLADSVAALD